MPETDYDFVSKEWLQTELRSDVKDLILLDCRSSNEFSESHIRSAVNFSIPSIMMRRLAAGKIDLLSTIKSPDLKERIQNGYKVSLFILYNDSNLLSGGGNAVGGGMVSSSSPESGGGNGGSSSNGSGSGGVAMDIGGAAASVAATASNGSDATINVLHRRLKQDGCRVVTLQDGFSNFRDAFPEWCEDDSNQQEMESSRGTQADQLMGLRSLRISTPHSDSACSSSAESSDCESTTHHNFNEAPVEIVPGLFLGNASHSGDSRALQKYNIKYVLNVTPDLPNVFEASGGIQYLQIPITDHYSQDLAMHFPAAIQFIEEARSKNAAVLVHCLAGVSRSVTVTLAYLMHTRALCLNEAFTLVRDRKPDVSPNFHFMEQLHSFERQLRLSPNETILMDASSSCVSDRYHASRGGNKFTCNCIASDCKCMQTSGFIANVKATGVSPDSGIEFDRWTPSSDTGLK
ncbi:dual specificity protein phosphatase Mpk3 [Episyrphus balteatus]|uniref:dual specificity protein phosphatase Mpk3 n=1 Tax=Episyrphus balteatus TaxID=286459 RepID=UPI0024854087|nr:dual specificity protein phosphatase Mpk3 [Episyrphus balteatus]